jgi:hypothetical protein
MDYIVLSTLNTVIPTSLTLSYDIACQWSHNFKRRVAQFPAQMQLSAPLLNSIKYVIPKFHIYGHGRQCQTKFSLNYLPHSACTNGEETEHWWAHINLVSMSTREMTAGARHDTIDDHAGAWNWRKVTNLGLSCLEVVPLIVPLIGWICLGMALALQLKEAHTMKSKHEELLEQFTAEFTPSVIAQWTNAIDAWNSDPSNPNPYEEVEIGELGAC